MRGRVCWPVVLGAILIAGCGGTPTSGPDAPPASAVPSGTAPVTTPVAVRTTEDNLREAARLARRTLASLPVAPGAHRLPGPPAGWDEQGSPLGSRTDPPTAVQRWWSTAADPASVAAFYTTHHPAGLRRPPGEDPVGQEGDLQVSEYQTLGHASSAQITAPTAEVSWRRLGDRTVVRAVVSVPARYARPPESMLAADQVTGVDVVRVRQRIQHHVRRPGRLPTVRLVAPADRATIDRLVTSFDHLPGSAAPGFGVGCDVWGDGATDRVVFHTADGSSLTAYDGNIYCGAQLVLRRDGRLLRGLALDPDPYWSGHTHLWFDLVDRLLRR